jgi:hypothetical protein
MFSMKPLKFSEVVEETAKRSGESVGVTETLLRLYFKEVRKVLTSLSHTSVQVLNLGTFNLKPHTVEKKLFRKRELLKRLMLEPHHREVVRREVAQEVVELEHAMKEIANEKQRKEMVKKNKKLYYEQRQKPDRDLEKEREDI